ncbi:MAG: ABC transporter permease, partial [Acidobacteria bacterium]|nr:ABC transporter permease [Acidobacteriota bacterium]
MSRLLRRSSWRYGTRHPLQSVLAVAGVAVGVAVVLAVDLANDSATRAFELSTEALTGRATHQVLGGPGGLDEEIYSGLVKNAPAFPAAPVIEETVTVATDVHRSLRLLGVDPVAEGPFRAAFDGLRRELGGLDLGTFLTRPGAVAATPETAGGLGLSVGEHLLLLTAGGEKRVVLVGLIEPRDRRQQLGLQDVLIADLSTAQEVLGWEGRLSRIDLLLPDGD